MRSIKTRGVASRQDVSSSPGETNTHGRMTGISDKEAGLRTKLIFWRVKKKLGRIPLSSRIHAHDPKLLQLTAGVSRHFAGPGKISAKLKELAQLKVAAIVGCPF